MTKLRQLWLLTALAAVVILAGGYFLMVSPKSSHASALRGEAQTQQAANVALQRQIDQLNKQKKDLPKKQALLAEFAGRIPNNPALPALIRSLSDAADNAGVELVSVTPAVPAFAKGSDVPGQGAGYIAAPGGTVLATIPVTLALKGRYSNLTQFFAELESLNRAMLVGGLDVKRDLSSGSGAAAQGGAATPVDPKLLDVTITTNVLMTTKAPAPAPVPVASTSNSDVTK